MADAKDGALLGEALIALRVAKIQLEEIADRSRRAADDCKDALESIEASLRDSGETT